MSRRRDVVPAAALGAVIVMLTSADVPTLGVRPVAEVCMYPPAVADRVDWARDVDAARPDTAEQWLIYKEAELREGGYTAAERQARLRADAEVSRAAETEAAASSLASGDPDEMVVATVSFGSRLSPAEVTAALARYELDQLVAYAGYPGRFHYFQTRLPMVAGESPGDVADDYAAMIDQQIRQYRAAPAERLPAGMLLLLADHEAERRSLPADGVPMIGVTVRTRRQQAQAIADHHADWTVGVIREGCAAVPPLLTPEEALQPYLRRLEHPLATATVNLETDLFQPPTPDGQGPPDVDPNAVPLEPIPLPDGTWVEYAGVAQ